MKKLSEITVTDQDIADIISETDPCQFSSAEDDICKKYREKRADALIGLTILTSIFPKAGAVLGFMIAVMDKLCEEEPKK